MGEMNLLMKQKESPRCGKQTYGYQGRKGEAVNREIASDIYTLLFIKTMTVNRNTYSNKRKTNLKNMNKLLIFKTPEAHYKEILGFPTIHIYICTQIYVYIYVYI